MVDFGEVLPGRKNRLLGENLHGKEAKVLRGISRGVKGEEPAVRGGRGVRVA